MIEVLEYFNIASDRELLVFVCSCLGLTFLIVLIFSFSDWILGKILALFSFAVPASHSISSEQYALGNRMILRIRWRVKGAEELLIPQLGLAINLNPFRSNSRRANHHTLGANGELFLELEQINGNQLQLNFRNLWGRYRVNLRVNSASNTKNSNVHETRTHFRNELHKAYLGLAQGVLLQQFTQSIPARKELLKVWQSRFEKKRTDVHDGLHRRLDSVRKESIVVGNLSFNEQKERYNQLYSQLANSGQIRFLREEFQRIRHNVQ
jgi:hypothetical protein